MSVKSSVFVFGLMATLVALPSCDSASGESTSSEGESKKAAQKKKKKKKGGAEKEGQEAPKVTRGQVDEALALKDAARESAIKALGTGAIPHLRSAFGEAVGVHRRVCNENVNTSDKSKAASVLGTARFKLDDIANALVILGAEGCQVADELLKEVLDSCSEREIMGSSECRRETSGLKKALRTCPKPSAN
jgi:hypothetical protein